MVMKKIFDGLFDEEVHVNFLKFGRGEYENKFMLEGKKQAKKWSIKASAEYANILVKKSFENLSNPIAIKGVIVSTLDLSNDIPCTVEKVSNFQGVRKHVVNTEVDPFKMIEFMNKFPKAFCALTFSGNNFQLKVKPKAPTSGKPGKEKEDGPSIDFCTLKTEDESILEELFFGHTNFKQIRITHTINVTDIVYPKNMNELKPSEIREQAKRKGSVKRIITEDEKETIEEAQFTV